MGQLIDQNGWPCEKNPYVFNGDFVDRGPMSIEVILTIFVFKLCFPKHVYMNRGNHEANQIAMMYGFWNECIQKYDDEIYQGFVDIFDVLPLGMRVTNADSQKKIFICHGGLYKGHNERNIDWLGANLKR